MDFQQLLLQRRSVRAYQDRTVEPAALDAVFAAASRAPSAGGLQAYRIHAVAHPSTRKALAAAAHGQDFVAQAPVVLVFCADQGRAKDYGKVREANYSVQDAMIAMAYAQLAATEQGLGSCWVGAFQASGVAAALDLKPAEIPVALLPLGYPAESPDEPSRRTITDLVEWHGIG